MKRYILAGVVLLLCGCAPNVEKELTRLRTIESRLNIEIWAMDQANQTRLCGDCISRSTAVDSVTIVREEILKLLRR
jgi:hypothetical protein